MKKINLLILLLASFFVFTSVTRSETHDYPGIIRLTANDVEKIEKNKNNPKKFHELVLKFSGGDGSKGIVFFRKETKVIVDSGVVCKNSCDTFRLVFNELGDTTIKKVRISYFGMEMCGSISEIYFVAINGGEAKIIKTGAGKAATISRIFKNFRESEVKK